MDIFAGLFPVTNESKFLCFQAALKLSFRKKRLKNLRNVKIRIGISLSRNFFLPQAILERARLLTESSFELNQEKKNHRSCLSWQPNLCQKCLCRATALKKCTWNFRQMWKSNGQFYSYPKGKCLVCKVPPFPLLTSFISRKLLYSLTI